MRRCVLPAPARITRPIKMVGIVDSDTQKKKSGTELHGNWRHCAKGALCSVPEASTTLPARSSEARWWRQCCPGAQTASFPDKYPKYYLRMHPSRPRRWRVVQAPLSSLSLSTKAWTSSLSSSISPVLTSSPWLWSFRNSFVNFWAFFLNAVLSGMTFCFR